MQYFMDIIKCDPSIYTIDHSDLTVPPVMEESIGLQGANDCCNTYAASF